MSMGANLAEGCGRQTTPELARFVRIAMGSASELDYHLLLVRDLGILEKRTYELLAQSLGELRRMLTALILRVDAERCRTKC